MHLLCIVCRSTNGYSGLKRGSLFYEYKNKQTTMAGRRSLRRFQLISPLLQADLDDAKRIMLRKKIAEENNVSVRSLYRYEKSIFRNAVYRLKPADREKHRSQKLPENFEFLLEQAIQLRKEIPERSVARSSTFWKRKDLQHQVF